VPWRPLVLCYALLCPKPAFLCCAVLCCAVSCTDYAEVITEIRTSVPGAVLCLAMFENSVCVLCAVLYRLC
jgi:hypothetical protein